MAIPFQQLAGTILKWLLIAFIPFPQTCNKKIAFSLMASSY